MTTKIEVESAKFDENESFIINYFNDEGRDFDEEKLTLKDAVSYLEYQWSTYYGLDGTSSNNRMAEPSLSHPDGSGREWDLEKECWN